METEEIDIHDMDQRLDELEKILEMPALVWDYYRCRKVLRESGLVNSKGNYVADFAGEKITYELPSWREIIGSMTSKDLEVYKMMKDAGWEPHLQITPIGKNWAEIWENMNKVGADLPMLKFSNKVSDLLKNEQALLYAPANYKAERDMDVSPAIAGRRSRANPKYRLFQTGAVKKDKLTHGAGGWLLDIVPLVENMKPDLSIMEKPDKNEVANAEQVARFDQIWRSKGYNGLGVESYTMAALMAKKIYSRDLDCSYTDNDACVLLTETVFPDPEKIIMARMHNGYLEIHPHEAKMRFKISRFRPSWRIKTPGT